MPDRSTTIIARLLLCTSLLLPFLVQAQTEPLYQVELVVFSRPAGAAAEHWDAIPELTYPSRSRFLIYPGEQNAEPAATSIPDHSAAVSGSTLAQPAQPTSFATLSPGQRQLAGKVSAMQRSGRYRILFHEAWIQPMADKAQSLPIVLDRSGDGGPWPALQGTIRLYLARYFYLDTNLWLNTQGEYLQSEWRMPAPPLAPMSRAQDSRRDSISDQGGDPGMPIEPSGIEQVLEQADMKGPQYPFRHAVLLNQTRRMRSGELAYIDHPLLGVLITVTPLATDTAVEEPPQE